MALLFEHIEREGDVGRGHPRPVKEARLRAKAEPIVELVARNPHRLCKQPIDRIGLVAVGRHQRVEGRRHAGGAIALPAVDVEGVEGVEILVAARAGDLQRQEPADRRLRIYIGEIGEIGRQGEIAERRQAVGLDGILGECGERSREERRERPARARQQRGPAGESHRHRSLGHSRALYRARRLFTSERGEIEAARRRDGGIALMLRNIKNAME